MPLYHHCIVIPVEPLYSEGRKGKWKDIERIISKTGKVIIRVERVLEDINNEFTLEQIRKRLPFPIGRKEIGILVREGYVKPVKSSKKRYRITRRGRKYLERCPETSVFLHCD